MDLGGALDSTVQASLVPEVGDSFFRFETSDSYAVGLTAIVLATVAVCHLVARFRTDPILRRSAFRGLIGSGSGPIPESGTSKSVPVSGETSQPRPAYGFTRQVRGEFIKETTLVVR